MAKGILVPIDFSDVTEVLLAQAAELAKALDAKIWLIHVADCVPVFPTYEVEASTPYPRADMAVRLRHEHQRLQEYQHACQEDGLPVTAMLVHGVPGAKIVEEAERFRPMMVAMGSHGHGALHNLMSGSVCEYVMKHAACPVMIVPSRTGTYTSDAEPKSKSAATTA